METDIALAHEAERDIDGVKRVLALIGIGYVTLACLAVYADYKIQMRRARKRREQAAKKEGKDEPPRR